MELSLVLHPDRAGYGERQPGPGDERSTEADCPRRVGLCAQSLDAPRLLAVGDGGAPLQSAVDAELLGGLDDVPQRGTLGGRVKAGGVLLPCTFLSVSYTAACRAVGLPVVWPVTPPARRSASSTTTVCPVRTSSHAAPRPTTPLPMTATSTSVAPSSGATEGRMAVSSQYERPASGSPFMSGDCPAGPTLMPRAFSRPSGGLICGFG